jgi:dolichol-phosphate mannosyltransferase
MLAKLKSDNLDLVNATRNFGGGTMGEFVGGRVKLSNAGKWLSRIFLDTDLSDPMSGFFILDRRFLDEVVHSASGVGFKILLDLVASANRPVRLAEIPYKFRKRTHGTSKLDILVGLEYVQLLLDKTLGNFMPPRFVMFGMVGATGYLIFAGLMKALMFGFSISFLSAQIATTYTVMTANFFLNNLLTYRDRRLRGNRLWIGLVTFLLACSVGALGNVQVARFLRGVGVEWYVAGSVGLAIGAVWNYGVTSMLTWRYMKNRSRLHERRSKLR